MGEKDNRSVKVARPVKSGEDDSPIRSILCIKKNIDLKSFEETDDCFILDFDPFEPIDLFKLSMSKNLWKNDSSSDFILLAEKGQVACRDYAHSRDLCAKFPFTTTGHSNYCDLCFCYVCDSKAPCKFWRDPVKRHCDASNMDLFWKTERNLHRLKK